MITDIDIWRCAVLMINNYGEEAAIEATVIQAVGSAGERDYS